MPYTIQHPYADSTTIDGDNHRENLQDARDWLNFEDKSIGASCLDRRHIARPTFEPLGVRANFVTGPFFGVAFGGGVGQWIYHSSHMKAHGLETGKAFVAVNKLCADIYVEEITVFKISASASIQVFSNVVNADYDGASGVYLKVSGEEKAPICPIYSNIIPSPVVGDPAGGRDVNRWRNVGIKDLVVLDPGWNRIAVVLDAKHDTCALTSGVIIVDGRSV